MEDPSSLVADIITWRRSKVSGPLDEETKRMKSEFGSCIGLEKLTLLEFLACLATYDSVTN